MMFITGTTRFIGMDILFKIIRIVKEEGYVKLGHKLWHKMRTIEFDKGARNFNTLYDQNKWGEAIEIAYGLNKKTYKNYEFLNKLAVCYFKNGDVDTANAIMKIGFQIEMNRKIEDIIHDIEVNIRQQVPTAQELKSTYIFNGGKRNFGLIEHECAFENESVTFITKITSNQGEERARFLKEEFFYKEIRESYPQLKAITPKMICAGTIKDTGKNFMTLEKITGRPSKISDLSRVLEIDAVIKSIKGEKIIKQIEDIVSDDSVSLTAYLHKRSANAEMFSLMHKKVRETEAFAELAGLVRRLEYIILDLQLYDSIVLDKHYTFCHGDYNKGNFIFRDSTNYIIDWAEYSMNFADADFANYFFKFNFSFEEIEESFLRTNTNGRPDDIIREIFFIYILIFKWVTQLDEEEADNVILYKIRPAISYIENAIDLHENEKRQKAEVF